MTTYVGDPYFANVVSLLHFDGADASTTFTDVTGRTWTTNGGAQIDTAQSVYGGAAGLFPATGDYISAADHADLEMGGGDFTLEFAFRAPSNDEHNRILIKGANYSSQGAIMIRRLNDNNVQFFASSAGSSNDIADTVAMGTLAPNTWGRFAVTRSGNTWRTYKDGTKISQFTSSSSIWNNTQPFIIGPIDFATTAWWMDEFRLTKGVARYTADTYSLAGEAFGDFGSPVGTLSFGGALSRRVSRAVPAAALSFSGAHIGSTHVDHDYAATGGEVTGGSAQPPADRLAGRFAALSGVWGDDYFGVLLQPLFGFSWQPGEFSGDIQALSGLFVDDGFGSTSLSALTGDFVAVHGLLGNITLESAPLSGDFSGPGNFDVTFEGALEALAARLLGEYVTAPLLEPMSAQFAGEPGAIGAITAQLRNLDGSFLALTPGVGALAAQLQALGGSFAGHFIAQGPFSGLLRPVHGAFTGLVGADGALLGVMERPSASFAGHIVASGSVSLVLPPLLGAFAGSPVPAALFRAWAMNTRRGGVTEYTSFPFNSFARYNGGYLAAGPDGLFRLVGEDDDGADIAWNVVTGQMDDKEPGLKRLTEVLMGLRASGPVRVTVWSDDETSYDYPLVMHRQDTLNQVRVKVGKGLRSRYFKVGVSGTGPSLELDSLQVVVPKTTRRIG